MVKERAVCLNCMDGRVQLPVINWIMETYDVDCVDMITEPGMDGLLADPQSPIEDIKRKLNISIQKNNASMIFVAGHHDCKGNPVSDTVHSEHIHWAVTRLKKEFQNIDFIGVWVNKAWTCEIVQG